MINYVLAEIMCFKNVKSLLIIFVLLRSEADTSYSHRPMDLTADLTNDLGVCILQIQSALQPGNVAFSPYGVASMSVLLFEGATGNTAIEIIKVLHLPWNTPLMRIGFRDINRHLKTYFRSDGFLRGLIMSRDDVCFYPSYQKMLRIYGFEEPDNALTYPCSGFTPYATSTTTFTSTSEEAVTVTSPSVKNETTEGPTTTSVEKSTPTVPQVDETENVVTELTQTSQTITIVNSTTFKPIEVEAINEALTSKQTDFPSKQFGGAKRFANFGTMTTNVVNTPNTDQTTIFSNIDKNTRTKESIVPKILTQSPNLQESANTIIESKFSSTLPRRNTETQPERTTLSTKEAINATISKIHQLQNSTNVTNRKNVIMPTENHLQTNNSNNLAPKVLTNNTEDDKQTNLGLNNMGINNLTLANDFGFSITDSPSILENFFDETTDLSFKPNGNFSSFGKGVKPTLDEELDFKNSTHFYTNLVNFIENTTGQIKNLFKPQDGNPTTAIKQQNVPKNKIRNVTLTGIQNDQKSLKHSQNSVPNKEKMVQNNTSFLSRRQNSINNVVKGTTEAANTRNLPTKSTLKNNQKPISAEISISPGAFKKSPDYYNILPLEQNKSISSTYKDVEKPWYRMKRDMQKVDQLYADTNNEKRLRLNDTQLKEAEILSNNQWKFNKMTPTVDIRQTSENNNKTIIETKFHRYTANEKGRNDVYGSLKAASNYNTDYRSIINHEYQKVPSVTHRYFLPSGTDWFTSHGQSILIPVFSYSAILPFAFIDDLKSKVLEIPLDDYNYQLLILLPTPDYGINYLINSLTAYSLRKIRTHLRNTAVFASIPKFSVVSQVNLRQALYYLGMRDVFHRYRADLSIMSPDARLFVRSIEQVITIHVDRFSNTAYPVPEPLTDRYFLATHPFLYFVIDKESGVSLVAGIMNDPLKQTLRFL